MNDAPGSSPESPRFAVRAPSKSARFAGLALGAVAALNVAYLAAHILDDVLTGSKSAPPLAVATGLFAFTGLPLLLSFAIGRASRGTLVVEEDKLVLSLPGDRFEIPRASIRAARPLALPLPRPGLALVLASGRAFERAISMDDPAALLAVLGLSKETLSHPSMRFAQARDKLRRQSRIYFFVKYGFLPLALAIVLFRLHQYIVYGGPFGQYHLDGLGPYLRSFAIRWAGIAGVLVVYAGLVRLVVEVLAFVGTYLGRSGEKPIRRGAEIIADVAYFGLIPGYVLSRLLA